MFSTAADECRKMAKEAALSAENAADPKQKANWLKIAEGWLKLAGYLVAPRQ